MTRGGKRPGAGRKALLDEQDEMSVGSVCERLWQEIAQLEAWKEYEGRHYVKDIRVEQRELQQIPISERRTAETSSKIEYAQESIGDILKYAKIVGPDDIKHDVVIENERSRLDKLAAERGGADPIIASRPYDAKDRILKAGVDWAKNQFDIDISESTVEKCWEKFRQLEAELRPEPYTRFD